MITLVNAKAYARRYILKDPTLTDPQIYELAEYLGFSDMTAAPQEMADNARAGYNASALGKSANYYNNLVYNAAINAGIYVLYEGSTIQAPLSKTFTTFDYTNDVVTTQESTTAGIFPGSVGTLSTFYTSSYQTATSKAYYLTVNDDTTSTANELFDIVEMVSGSINYLKPNVMYKEVANIVLSGSSQKFVVNSQPCSSSYAIIFKRTLFKEQLDPGNWEITHFGKTYIDDSGDSHGTIGPTGKVYNVVSGSISGGIVDATPLGLFYPTYGMVLLNRTDLSGSYADDVAFFDELTSISGRTKQVLKNSNYFCRVKNKEYNYSNNPTFLSSSGEYIQAAFKNNPKVFPTGVGLYNDDNELLATAKLSKPFQKGYDTEMSIKVKLSF